MTMLLHEPIQKANVDSAFLCTILWTARKLGVSWSPLDEIRAITVPGLVIDMRIAAEVEKGRPYRSGFIFYFQSHLL